MIKVFTRNFLFTFLIVLFPFLHHHLSLRPPIKNINLKKEARTNYEIEKINFDNKIKFSQKKRISISNTYLIKDHLMGPIYLTNFSAWSYNTLNFSSLSDDLPYLVIKNPVIKRINTSSYAKGSINNKYFSQACMIDSNNFYFDKPQYKRLNYSDLSEWYKIFKKTLRKNIFLNPRKHYSCLLLTSSNLEFFENELQLIFDLIKLD